jgi:ketosteroid isomerase-like protein
MSQENVEFVRAMFEGFEGIQAGDRESWRGMIAEDVIWDTSATRFPQAGVYEGHSGVERFFIDWLGTWERPVVEALDYIDAGDSVVVVFRWSGRGRTSGIDTAMTMFAVYDLKDAQVVRFRQYETRKQALEAAGLSE